MIKRALSWRPPGSAVLATLYLAFAALAPAHADSPALLLDGSFDDWPDGVVAQADPYYLYLQLVFPEKIGLQSARVATHVLLDLDDDVSTGRKVTPGTDDNAPLGVDLALLFAPVDGRDEHGVGGGAAALAYGPGQRETRLRHQQVGFAALPTYTSQRYELRVPRHVLERGPAAAQLRRAGTARALIRRIGADGETVWESQVLSFERPAAAPAPWRAQVDIPRRASDAVRIMSANVEWAAPLTDPAPFARILKALDPDIVLLQEWDRIERRRGQPPIPRESADAIAEWFNTHAPGERRWQVRRSPELGIAIASRDALTALGGERIAYRLSEGDETLLGRGVRYVGALSQTRAGPVAVASLHLKCCGAWAAEEDLQRQAEAVTVNAAFRRALADSPAVMAVIGGDFNLVGARSPKQTIARGLDLDGSDLAAAPLLALGGHAATTWRDPRSRFSPSRLDYMLYSDSSAELLNAFALDTAVLDAASLRRHGLRAEDSAFSDHLPIVIDLRRRSPP
ncbi:MAG: endonuclease/exonuclease/phosphatase family protein [Gammaproteobacteria bacterium]|nr:endonuclease/exonuclease/phosphatase family protein [Gammaproteobacteria bacterium]